MTPDDVIGRWDIVDWVQRYDDGRLAYPLGQSLEGFVRYEPDGAMFIVISATGRPNFTTGGQWNASDGEKARAYDGFFTYAGTYELGDGEIRHHIQQSLYPDWSGVIQKRRILIDGDRLELATGVLEAGTSEARRAVLTWRRPAASVR